MKITLVSKQPYYDFVNHLELLVKIVGNVMVAPTKPEDFVSHYSNVRTTPDFDYYIIIDDIHDMFLGNTMFIDTIKNISNVWYVLDDIDDSIDQGLEITFH